MIDFVGIDELLRVYRRRTVSPAEVVGGLLERLDKVEGRMNAFVTVLRDEARQSAARSERVFLRGGEGGPLEGVPVTVKDNISTRLVRTTCASRILQSYVPAQDASVVRRLRSAGAIIVGKCNLNEFAYGATHPDYGRCNNPWHLGRTPGGSSSGSAASVAAGIGAASLGSDTGGSIRIPASYCGVVGLKPTLGSVPVDGVFPLSWSLDHVGPIARSVRDVERVYYVLTRSRGRSHPGSGKSGSGSSKSEQKSTRIGVVRQHLTSKVHANVAGAFGSAMELLQKAGLMIVDVDIPMLDHSDAALDAIIMSEAAVVHHKWIRERPNDYAKATRQQLEVGNFISANSYLLACRYRNLLHRRIDEALENVDVLAMPTVPFAAPENDPVMGEGTDAVAESLHTGPFNLTGHPAISIPCGFTADGLPIGLQFVARLHHEARLFGVSELYENEAGWSTRHPEVER